MSIIQGVNAIGAAGFALFLSIMPGDASAPAEPAAPVMASIDIATAMVRAITPPAAPAATAATLDDRQIDCLANAMWFEAGNQGETGQVAVAEVVLARTTDSRFEETPCGVIAQRNQFSFVRRGVIPTRPDIPQTQHLEELARRVVAGEVESPVKGAKFFHATYVSIGWDARQTVRVGRIRDHIFYADRRARRPRIG